MTMEVLMGARPGRPRLALLLSAALLVGALALAWGQARNLRAFGPEQQVGKTPLWVRVPRGWLSDPDEPGRFLLPSHEESWRRKVFGFERRVTFHWDVLPEFSSLERLRPWLGLDDPRHIIDRSVTHIGRFDAIEVSRVDRQQIGRVLVQRQTIMRVACLPRGQLLQVIYEPLDSLTPADHEIVDEICQSVRIDDPSLNQPAEEYLRRAGLQLPAEYAKLVVGPRFEEVPGVYIGGSVDGVPAWSIGIFRTWLATGRKPRDLLADLAAERWSADEADEDLPETTRPDGAVITHIRYPRIGLADEPMPAAWLVQPSEGWAALLLVFAGPTAARAADEIAGQVAAGLELTPLEGLPDLARAEQAGLELARTLSSAGPVARWGRETVEVRYVGQSLGGREVIRTSRQARERNPQLGYQGMQITRREPARGAPQEQHYRWVVDGKAETYELMDDRIDDSGAYRVRERRSAPGAEVLREIVPEKGRTRAWRFTPGPSFLPPPVESIAEGWVARGEPPAAIIEVSSLSGPNTRTLLLRHLPPDGKYPRVLIQSDSWPLGAIQAYDDDTAETEYEFYPTAEYHRVP